MSMYVREVQLWIASGMSGNKKQLTVFRQTQTEARIDLTSSETLHLQSFNYTSFYAKFNDLTSYFQTTNKL